MGELYTLYRSDAPQTSIEAAEALDVTKREKMVLKLSVLFLAVAYQMMFATTAHSITTFTATPALRHVTNLFKRKD